MIFSVLAACGSGSSTNSANNTLEPNATVERVVDGDTLVVNSDGVEARVRLIGIDTPESVHPSKPVMCFGKEASAQLAELLPEGTEVQLVNDVEARDRYDRVLAYVYRAKDGEFINMRMVTDGYAQQYTFPPNVAHADQFRQAASAARREGVGLWSNCDKPFEE